MTGPFDQAPRPDPRAEELVRQRQRGRARILAILLGAFVILVFAISIAKIQAGMHAPGAHVEMQH